MSETPALDQLQAVATEATVAYLDSLTGGPRQPRTAAITRLACAVSAAGAHEASPGPAWELAEAWDTAHRVLNPDLYGTPCPCAEHTPGSAASLANLTRLVAQIHPDPDLDAALRAIEDEERYPRPGRAPGADQD